jgi:hypothetical protein
VATVLRTFVDAQGECADLHDKDMTCRMEVPPFFSVEVENLRDTCALLKTLHLLLPSDEAVLRQLDRESPLSPPSPRRAGRPSEAASEMLQKINTMVDRLVSVAEAIPAKWPRRAGGGDDDVASPRGKGRGGGGGGGGGSGGGGAAVSDANSCVLHVENRTAVFSRHDLKVALSGVVTLALPLQMIEAPTVTLTSGDSFDTCQLLSALQAALPDVPAASPSAELLRHVLSIPVQTMAHVVSQIPASLAGCEHLIDVVGESNLGRGASVSFRLPPPPMRPVVSLVALDSAAVCALMEAIRTLPLQS